MSRRNSSRTSGSVGTSRGPARASSLPSPFSPSTTSPLRIQEPTAHLRLTSLERAQLLELAQYVSSELVSLAILFNTSKLKKKGSHGVLRTKTVLRTDYPSLDAYQTHVHPYAMNCFNATSTLCAIPTSQEYTSITVKWSIAKGTWTHDRDFCYVEVQKPFVSPAGQRGYVRCIHSIPLFISSSKTRCIRASLVHSGIVVMETQTPGHLQETIVMNVDPRGRMPKWVAAIMVRRLLVRTQTQPFYVTNDISKTFHGRTSLHDTRSRRHGLGNGHGGPGSMRASAHGLHGLHAPRSSLRDLDSVCKVCTSRLKWFRPKIKCKVCDSMACKPCSTHCEALLKPTDRVCLHCNEQLTAMLAKSDVPSSQPEDTFIFVDDWDE